MTYTNLSQSPGSESHLFSLPNFSTIQSNLFYALTFFWVLQECAFPAYTEKHDSHFLFLLSKQLEMNTVESLKSFYPFDFTVLLIMKNELEVFRVCLAQWRTLTYLPCLIMFMETLISMLVFLLTCKIKFLWSPVLLNFVPRVVGNCRVGQGKKKKYHLRCVLTEATKKLLSERQLSVTCSRFVFTL